MLHERTNVDPTAPHPTSTSTDPAAATAVSAVRTAASDRSGEPARLHALYRYRVIDTPPDTLCDTVTHVVAQVLGVPISVISLVDHDRVWFLSRHGIDAAQVDRAPGLCASAILHDGTYVLEDTHRDLDALANPLVARRHGFRFYAGTPLRTHDGHNLGALAAIDVAPRRLSNQEQRVLTDLAQIVIEDLERRSAAHLLADAHHALGTAHAELRQANERLAASARRDCLTGLPNRTAILEALEQTLALAQREERPMAVLIADIDDFKAVNDDLGHLAGDDVISAVAARMDATIRDGDTVGRLGGDEFLAVMYPCDGDEAQAIADRVLRAVRDRPIRSAGDRTVVACVTISAGAFSTRVEPTTTARDLLRAADHALYAAKRGGRDRTQRA